MLYVICGIAKRRPIPLHQIMYVIGEKALQSTCICTHVHTYIHTIECRMRLVTVPIYLHLIEQLISRSTILYSVPFHSGHNRGGSGIAHKRIRFHSICPLCPIFESDHWRREPIPLESVQKQSALLYVYVSISRDEMIKKESLWNVSLSFPPQRKPNLFIVLAREAHYYSDFVVPIPTLYLYLYFCT